VKKIQQHIQQIKPGRKPYSSLKNIRIIIIDRCPNDSTLFTLSCLVFLRLLLCILSKNSAHPCSHSNAPFLGRTDELTITYAPR